MGGAIAPLPCASNVHLRPVEPEEGSLRILILHNRYQLSGGEDQVVEAERALLESAGHATALVEARNDTLMGPPGKARAALSALYSLPSRRRVRAEIRRFGPDVVHVHNFFPLLSPSVYDACLEEAVPVVQTLHNYRLICSNALLFREEAPCEDCLGKMLPWPGVWRGCYHGSRRQSAAVALMIAAHRLRATWQRRVAAFVTLTSFQRELMTRAGLPAERLHVKPHFLADPGLADRRSPGSYALFVGRLSAEKGLSTLIEAYRSHGVGLPLKIVGEGPQRPELEALAAGLSQVEFLGPRPRREVLELMREARFLVFPSTCYETFGLAIIEAFALGLPVIASRLGGIPELLAAGERGWLVEPGLPSAWARTLAEAWNDLEGLSRKSSAARAAYEEHFGPRENHRRLMDIYQEALAVPGISLRRS